MSYEINSAIELSSEELDLVAGGALQQIQTAAVNQTQLALANGLVVTGQGVQFLTQFQQATANNTGSNTFNSTP